MAIINTYFKPITKPKYFNTSSPCKDCEDRNVGCHSKCEKYIEFKRMRDERKTENKIKREYDYYLAEKFQKYY